LSFILCAWAERNLKIYLFFCNLEMESLLSMLLVMIIPLVV
jgi:hypothetical protein